MKSNQYTNIDGFVRRRPRVELPSAGQPSVGRPQLSSAPTEAPRRSMINDYPALRPSQPQVDANFSGVGEQPEIDDDLRASLSALSDGDIPGANVKKRRFGFHRSRRRRDDKNRRSGIGGGRRGGDKPPKKRWSRRKKLIFWPITLVILSVVGVGGFLAAKAFFVSNGVFNGGNILSLITPGTPLKTDDQGRTNILVFGTSQDDSAHQQADGGGGLWLTDSILLVSLDQKAETVRMVSIPRDLWVAVDNCEVGNNAKINAVYECASGLINSGSNPGSDYKQTDQAGAEALMQTVATVTGITPQYYVHANYTVLRDTVNAVGGIDVNIVGDGASGIYDTNFDWDCPNGPYTCKNVYYPKDGVYHIDGTQALFLARARGDAGLYSYRDFGLARGDFDRQMNQQKILTALQKKATTASVLANPLALNNLLDAFGNNISMSLSGGEIKTLLDAAHKIQTSNIKSVSLVDDGHSVVTTGMIDGQSVVVPLAGTQDYNDIISYLAKQMSTNPVVSEAANVSIYNASGVAGAAGNLQTKFEKEGYTVADIGDAPSSAAGSGEYTIYDHSNGAKPKTLAALQKELGVTATTSPLPDGVTSDSDFVIIINSTSTNN